jgi:hypothetical protein
MLVGKGGGPGLLDGIGSFIGGFFADGGDPPVGVPSIVGERGPEIFVPKTAGTVIPNPTPSAAARSSSSRPSTCPPDCRIRSALPFAPQPPDRGAGPAGRIH